MYQPTADVQYLDVSPKDFNSTKFTSHGKPSLITINSFATKGIRVLRETLGESINKI